MCVGAIVVVLAGCGGGTTTAQGSSNLGYECLTDYSPNYTDAILTSSDANVKGSFAHWTRFPIKVGFVVDGNWSLEKQAAAQEGFASWMRSTGNNLSLVYVVDPNDANVKVSFVGSSELGRNVLGITATYINTRREIGRVEMRVLGSLSLADIAGVCAHEMGHGLGIQGHSPFGDDLMYYALNATRTPTLRDTNTLQANYCGSFASRTRSTEPEGPFTPVVIVCER